MAGMLPGVECARRRRIHQGGAGTLSDSLSTPACIWSRRSYFSLYTSSHDTHHASAATRNLVGGGGGGYRDDVNLGGAAREAKERLDVKLRSQLKSDFGRSSYTANGQSSMHVAAARNLLTEVFGMKKDGGGGGVGGRIGGSCRMLKWGRLNWRSTEQEECAVCLDRFKVGENLVNLPCAHRFHTRCLIPWLETNSHCPCCRMDVVSPSPSL